ncbi:MAG: TIGR02147 family protein [Deltaproteobacteria bacterium]|nr:TIGR02147 family protein [Deltaproteobacteria bacterium]
MKKENKEINIFQYRNFRSFLKDWFTNAKETKRSFSFRQLAQKAGFQSKNFPLLVMQNKRNLTEDSIRKLSIALDLNKQEEEFFRELVFFNQSKTHDEKNHYYQQLLQCKKAKKFKVIEKEKYDYYSEWYHPVVRELIASQEFDGTSEWIANKISPKITPSQASRSIQLLENLDLIRKTGPNQWSLSSTVIDTAPEIDSTVVHNYHKKLLDLTRDRMDQLSLEHRDTSAMTLGVKKERLIEIKKRVQAFRQEILKLVEQDETPEEVFQLNIHLYPVTTTTGKKGGAQ